MKLTIKEKKEHKEFTNIFLPKLIVEYILSCYKGIPKKEKKKFNKYLKKSNLPNLKEIMNNLKDNIAVIQKDEEKTIEISIREDSYFKGYKYISLIKLVEYGNLEIDGLHFLDKAFKYVEDNIRLIYIKFAKWNQRNKLMELYK